MKSYLILLAPLLTLFPLPSQADDRAPIVIGWSGPLTGHSAVVGVDSAKAVQLKLDEVNRNGGVAGRPVKLVVEDDGYDTARAVSAYKKLVHQDRATIIIANTYGGVFATARDALRDGVIIIDPLDCNEEIAKLPANTFCLATRTESISAAFAARILATGKGHTLALVEESDGWMQLIAENLQRELERNGRTITLDPHPAITSTYKPSLLRAKSRSTDSIVLLGNDGMGRAVREMRELQLPFTIYGIGSILSPGFQAAAGGTVEGAFVSSWSAPRTKEFEIFLTEFMSRHGRAPYLELATVPSYDATTAALSCLEATIQDGTSDRELRECLIGTRFKGLTGTIDFDSDGAVRSINERIFMVQNGGLVASHTLPTSQDESGN